LILRPPLTPILALFTDPLLDTNKNMIPTMISMCAVAFCEAIAIDGWDVIGGTS
jgi:hypothetical protein